MQLNKYTVTAHESNGDLLLMKTVVAENKRKAKNSLYRSISTHFRLGEMDKAKFPLTLKAQQI